MANPPAPTSFTATTTTPVTHGTILHYGLEDLSLTGVLIDSYRRSGKYARTDEVVGQNGITEGFRMSDFRADVSVSGRLLQNTAYAGKVGDILTINGDKILIMDISMSAGAAGFAQVDISGQAFEGITGLEPA
jgi:hypothetical protein